MILFWWTNLSNNHEKNSSLCVVYARVNDQARLPNERIAAYMTAQLVPCEGYRRLMSYYECTKQIEI